MSNNLDYLSTCILLTFSDNDRSSLNCASMLKGKFGRSILSSLVNPICFTLIGGWWWKSCGRGLNGLYLTDPQDLTARQGKRNLLWQRSYKSFFFFLINQELFGFAGADGITRSSDHKWWSDPRAWVITIHKNAFEMFFECLNVRVINISIWIWICAPLIFKKIDKKNLPYLASWALLSNLYFFFTSIDWVNNGFERHNWFGCHGFPNWKHYLLLYILIVWMKSF